MLAHDFDEFGNAVGVGGVGEYALIGVEVDGVFVAAEQVDGVAADAQARAGDQALVDGVAYGGIGRTGAFGTHVALGGEAGHQVVLRGENGDDGPLRHGFLNRLQIFGAGVQEQVDVGIDEAGKQRAVAQVDGFGVGGMRDVAPASAMRCRRPALHRAR